MRLLSATLLIISTFITSTSHAIDTERTLYRISFSPPGTVFEEGFPIAGYDNDFLHYISGSSVRNGSSRYISLFDDFDVTLRRAQQFADNNPHAAIYIYEVRQTMNFYNVLRSLEFAASVLPDPEATSQIRQVMLAERESLIHTWASTDTITSDQIEAAWRFWDGGPRPSVFDHIRNENYVFAPAQVNPRPLPVRNETLNNLDAAEEPHGAGYVAAFVANIPCDRQPQQLGTSRMLHCLPLIHLPVEKAYQLTIAKMIASGILMNSTSGQLWSEPGHDEL